MLACFFAPKASYKMTILKKVILFFSYPPAYFNSPKNRFFAFCNQIPPIFALAM